MTIEEVKKHFESIGVKEGDVVRCPFLGSYFKNWKYSDMIERERGDVDTYIDKHLEYFDPECSENQKGKRNGFWLYHSKSNEFATPVKNEE